MYGDTYEYQNEEVTFSNEFINKLQTLKAEGMKLKSSKQLGDIWKPEFDAVINQLDELISIAQFEQVETAEAEFEATCPLYGKPSFSNYIISQKSTSSSEQLNVMRYTNTAGGKVRVNRASSKIGKCKLCGSKTKIEGDKVICLNPSCANEVEIASKTNRSKTGALKHSHNKLEMLLGLKNPPKKILDIVQYIEIWLTDLNYLLDWLEYKENKFTVSKTNNTMQKWFTDFKMIYVPKKSNVYWNEDDPSMRIIPKEPRYSWEYQEYKMLITEFHAMVEEIERLGKSMYTTSNVDSLSDDAIVELYADYYKKTGKIPDLDVKYTYKGETYDIGNYINNLKLTCDDSDVKKRLDQLFGVNIHMPGLMVNYVELTGKRKTDRFTLTESYSYIIHNVFKIKYVEMSETDINNILNLIKEFDAFVRSQNKDDTHKLNSKLYTCKLKCIMILPYFYNKYEIDLDEEKRKQEKIKDLQLKINTGKLEGADVTELEKKLKELKNEKPVSRFIKYIPTKSIDTTNNISTLWQEFMSTDGKDIVSKYDVQDEKTSDEDKVDDTIVTVSRGRLMYNINKKESFTI